MTGSFQSMSHSKWDCKYHVVFIPKRRRKAVFGNLRKQLGGIFHELARQKKCQIIEGHLMPDHVHMCISIPPKYSVASVIGFIKGKSAIAIARQFQGRERNYTGEHFWARGYCVSTVMKKIRCELTSASKKGRRRRPLLVAREKALAVKDQRR
jgi:putative transposase